MVGHRYAALPALGDVSAIRAEQAGGESAPVKEKDALFFLLKAVNQLVRQQGGDGRALVAPGQALASHVNQVNARQLAVVDPLEHTVHRVFPPLHVVERLERWRGRTDNAESLVAAGPVNRDIAAVVARIVLLLVGRLMLLIHDHQLEVLHRCEHRRAGADYDAGLPAGQGSPGIVAFAVAQMAVPDHGLDPARLQPRANAPYRLRSKGHFGHEKNNPASGGHDALDRVQVDLGFARAGYPVQQPHAEFAAVYCPEDGLDTTGLLGCQFRPDGVDLLGGFIQVVRVGDALLLVVGFHKPTLADQCLAGRSADAQPLENDSARLRLHL